MSLLDDLTKINEIKANIKNAIQNKGQSVTNFESYPDAINNISGSSSGQVKLFESIEEMDSDENPIEGDLALVYKNESHNMLSTDTPQIIKFPEKVVLPSMISTSYSCSFRAVDSSKYVEGNIQLSKTYFRFTIYTETTMYRVEYTGLLGKTYTRKTEIEIIDCETPIQIESNWNDLFGNFMIVGESNFGGVYVYNSTKSIYENAPNQLTLKDASELLPGKTAYGGNGEIIGNETIYENLDYNLINKQILNKGVEPNLVEIKKWKSSTDNIPEEYGLKEKDYFGTQDASLLDSENGITVRNSKILSGDNTLKTEFLRYTDYEEDRIYVFEKQYDFNTSPTSFYAHLHIYKISTGEEIQDKIIQVPDSSNFPDTNNIVKCIKQNGAIWFIGTYSVIISVYKYTIASDIWELVHTIKKGDSFGYSINCSCFDENDVLYISSFDGIYKYNNDSSIQKLLSLETTATVYGGTIKGKFQSTRYAVTYNLTNLIYLYNIKTNETYTIDVGEQITTYGYSVITFDIGENTYIILLSNNKAYKITNDGIISEFELDVVKYKEVYTNSYPNHSIITYDEKTDSVFLFEYYGFIQYNFATKKTIVYTIPDARILLASENSYLKFLIVAQKVEEQTIRKIIPSNLLESDYLIYKNGKDLYCRESDAKRLFGE